MHCSKKGKKFKYETHMHTKEASACAASTGAEMAQAYKAAGYTGIIVTDHFFNCNTAIPENLPWETRVDLFCRGYRNALEEGKKCGLHVFFAWEYTYRGADLLTYGLDQDFLLANPDILSWSVEEYFNVIHQNGGFISYAHPFRGEPEPVCLKLYTEHVDAVEVINTRNQNPESDERALRYAQEHGLLRTCGSDTHEAWLLKGGGMEFDRELHSIREFIREVTLAGGLPPHQRKALER